MAEAATQVDQTGEDLIERFEGLSLTWYKCPAGVWTIGYGHTGAIGAPAYRVGQRITQAEANSILASDLRSTEAGVSKLLKRPLPINKYDAVVSLAYNIGVGAFGGSHLLEFVNNGDFASASAQFLLWDRSGGRVLPGLVQRRRAEQLLFNTPNANPKNQPAGSRFDMPRKVDVIPGVNTRPSIVQAIESLL